MLGRLPHISLPKCVQSGQTPIDEGAEDAALEAAPCELGEEAYHGG